MGFNFVYTFKIEYNIYNGMGFKDCNTNVMFYSIFILCSFLLLCLSVIQKEKISPDMSHSYI